MPRPGLLQRAPPPGFLSESIYFEDCCLECSRETAVTRPMSDAEKDRGNGQVPDVVEADPVVARERFLPPCGLAVRRRLNRAITGDRDEQNVVRRLASSRSRLKSLVFVDTLNAGIPRTLQAYSRGLIAMAVRRGPF